MRNVLFLPSAARTVSGQSTPVKSIRSRGPAAVYLDVTAASGTSPTLDVDIEEFDRVSQKWFVVASFAQAIAAGNERLPIEHLPGIRYRASWAITGTSPSFTFSVSMNTKGLS